MLTAVVGQTFHGTLAAAPVDQTPKREAPNVAPGTSASIDMLKERQSRVDFPLLVPTVIERSSWIDRKATDQAATGSTTRTSTRRSGSPTGWARTTTGACRSRTGRRARARSSNFHRSIGGRTYDLYYNGPHLHMVVLNRKGASYWVVNSAARPAVERDDARDRQGPAADRQGAAA